MINVHYALEFLWCVKFAKSLKLDYPILSDPSGKTAVAYGVVNGERLFPRRWTFIIGKNGKILAIDKQVKPSKHASAVIKKLTELKVTRAE